MYDDDNRGLKDALKKEEVQQIALDVFNERRKSIEEQEGSAIDNRSNSKPQNLQAIEEVALDREIQMNDLIQNPIAAQINGNLKKNNRKSERSASQLQENKALMRNGDVMWIG